MEYQAGNIFLRPNPMEKGQTAAEHMHEFDHVTFFVKGKFRAKRSRRALDTEGKQVMALVGYQSVTNAPVYEEVWIQISDCVFSAGQWCLIEKDVKHTFEALEDGLFCCCYSHRDPQSGEVVQDYNGWVKAYE